eukprot:CAMPEP_0174886532 /NCGR_PEP_ID=MMETSP0167-20121228/1782_1 /TAXON_ID=38298 /ORGANISM="Rhodella maculata, Strain CCMP736" /LENGTH=193 /DNA_ID=CAMNT_0016122601 /DNA_START=44 /DNA_END=625 /DNA_ORIENTATION=+
MFGLVNQQIDKYLHSNPEFQSLSHSAFTAADSNSSGTLTSAELPPVVDALWAQIEPKLVAAGLPPLTKPAPEVLDRLFETSDKTTDKQLDEEEFRAMFGALLKLAAKESAGQVAKTYGLGIVLGALAVHMGKAALVSVPVVGGLLGKVLEIVPSMIAGPVLGVLTVFGILKGDVFLAEKMIAERIKAKEEKKE